MLEYACELGGSWVVIRRAYQSRNIGDSYSNPTYKPYLKTTHEPPSGQVI